MNNKDQVVFVSETKKKGKGNTKYGEYIFIYSGKDKNERAASGVGLLLHKRFQNNISDTKYISDRIEVTINLHKSKLTHLISVYAPDIGKPKDEIEQFFMNLQTTLDDIPRQDELIILGDLNARVGNTVIPGVMNRFNEETNNETDSDMRN